MIIKPSLSCIHWLEFVYRMNAVPSFCCDLILDVHYDIITSEMTLKMKKPAVVFDATFIFCLLPFFYV